MSSSDRNIKDATMKSDPNKKLKILMIGDREVGKTSIFLTYFSNTKQDKLSKDNEVLNENNRDCNNNERAWPHLNKETKQACVHSNLDTMQLNTTGTVDQYIATTLSVYRCDVKINSEFYGLSMTDTSGCRHNKKFVQLRKHYYTIQQDIDVIIMCFSLVDPVSYSNITKKWYPEIREYYKEVPILLVGTKSDIKFQIKHQLKCQKHTDSQKNSTNKDSSFLNSTGNTTFTTINSWTSNLKKKVNFMHEYSGNKQQRSQTLGNVFTAAAASVADVGVSEKEVCDFENSGKQTKCYYCTILEKKQKQDETRSLSNLTRAQIGTTGIPSRLSTVSIISKVSQQHFFDANTIFFETPEPIDPVQLEQPVKTDKPNGLGLINLKTIPKLLTNIMNKSPLSKSKTSNIAESVVLKPDKELPAYEHNFNNKIDDNASHLESDYANLNIDDLDGLITNLRKEINATHIDDENIPLQSVCTNTVKNQIKCNCVNLCESCQKIVDIQGEKIFESVAGKVDEETNTAVSVLNDSKSGELQKPEKCHLDITNETLHTVPEQFTELPSKAPEPSYFEIDLKKACQQQLIKKRMCLKLMREINAKKYLQCSALDTSSVKDVMNSAIELALDYNLHKIKKQKATKTNTIHWSAKDLKEHPFDSSTDSNPVENYYYQAQQDVLLTNLNEFIPVYTSIASISNKPRNTLSKKFSNSTEKNYDNEESIIVKEKVEQSLIELDRLCQGIELPIEIEKSISIDDERGMKKQKGKCRLRKKKSRSLSRCLSCTRGKNDTINSLNKI